MARVDKDGDLRRDMAEMKGEVLQTVRQSGHRPRPWLGCIAIGLGFILLMFGVVAWAVAATGLVNVPLVTPLAYHRPEPSHASPPTTPLDVYVSALLNRELTERLQRGGGTLTDRSISVALPEGAFTASLRQALEGNAQTAIDASHTQIAVNPEGLEMYLPLANNPRGSAVLLRLHVEAGQDGLTLRISDVRVGSLPVPNFITEAALMPAVKESFAGFARELGRYATISSVSYARGVVTLHGELSVEVLKLK